MDEIHDELVPSEHGGAAEPPAAVAVATGPPTDDLEFDVCEDGVIASEHGSDGPAALTEAIRRRRESDADVVTVLVTVRP
jgi:hypothetical protein